MKKSENKTYQSHFTDIYGSKMYYVDEGKGDPILFLHTVPASSHAWRNVIPHLALLGRCIAPDFIGMGKSDKPDIAYTIDDQIKYIEKFIETLKLKNITLIMHGWGSIIGTYYAMKHPDHCKGLVFYEAYLRPFDGHDVSLPYQEQISSMKKEKEIDNLILNTPYLVEHVLPQEMLQTISKEEMEYYKQPYLSKGSGKALYQYWKELSSPDGKSQANKMIADYSKKLSKSSLPKLLLYSVPGFITTVSTLVWAKNNLPNLEITEVGEDLHYALESNPTLLGEAISAWLQSIDQQIAAHQR